MGNRTTDNWHSPAKNNRVFEPPRPFSSINVAPEEPNIRNLPEEVSIIKPIYVNNRDEVKRLPSRLKVGEKRKNGGGILKRPVSAKETPLIEKKNDAVEEKPMVLYDVDSEASKHVVFRDQASNQAIADIKFITVQPGEHPKPASMGCWYACWNPDRVQPNTLRRPPRMDDD